MVFKEEYLSACPSVRVDKPSSLENSRKSIEGATEQNPWVTFIFSYFVQSFQYWLILHISMNCVLQESQILLWGIKEFIRYHIIEQQVPPQGDISKFSISTMLKVKVKVNIIIQFEVERVGQHINRIFHHGRAYLLFPGLDLVHDVQLSRVWTANYLELMSGLIKS